MGQDILDIQYFGKGLLNNTGFIKGFKNYFKFDTKVWFPKVCQAIAVKLSL